MASHVFTRSYRMRPRRGYIGLYGLGDVTVGDNANNTLAPDASIASIVSPTGVPSSSGPDVNTANDILPTPAYPTGQDVTPPQVAPSAVASPTPDTSPGITAPGAAPAMTPVVKHDVWYMARKIAPWAVGGALALGLGTFLWRSMRRRTR